MSILRNGSTRFADSDLCAKDEYCQLLITGFIEHEPLIAHITLQKKKVILRTCHDAYAIGDGAQAASLMLKHRRHDPLNSSLEETCYLVYEAKQFSETVSSVGKGTRMYVHGPSQSGSVDHAAFADLTSDAIEALENLRQERSMRAVGQLEKFPDHFFSTGPSPLAELLHQLTTRGQKSLPPSQE